MHQHAEEDQLGIVARRSVIATTIAALLGSFTFGVAAQQPPLCASAC